MDRESLCFEDRYLHCVVTVDILIALRLEIMHLHSPSCNICCTFICIIFV